MRSLPEDLTRRGFVATGLGAAGGVLVGGDQAGARRRVRRSQSDPNNGPFGPPVRDPGGVIDLPPGFQYRILSQVGGRLRTGEPIPATADGMGAMRGPRGTTILVRNHELSADDGPPVPATRPYDAGFSGGTTALVVSPKGRLLADYVSSSGTDRNCSGGVTPWNTWLTCEEPNNILLGASSNEQHGFVFEVDPTCPENELTRRPITAMGRFRHEAAVVDPATSIVYLTEDSLAGSLAGAAGVPSGPAFLYRFIPNDRSQRPGSLGNGGVLQAMNVDQVVPRDADLFEQGQTFRITWRTVDPDQPQREALAQGALQFNRLEGADFRGGALFFNDTTGGERALGQTFRYVPATNTLELFLESEDPRTMQNPDNAVVTPFGDFFFVEDGEGTDRIVAITPGRRTYVFGINRLSDSEIAGPTFSPDGRVFFVNLFSPATTLAITGPFPRPSRAAQARMARARPPRRLTPRVSEDLADAGRGFGLSRLETAALDRLGVDLRRERRR